MKPNQQISTPDFFNQPLPKERRPLNKSRNNKGPDFSSMLHSPEKPHKHKAQGTKSQPLNSKQAQAVAEKAQNSRTSNKEAMDPRASIKKPSRAIRSWGRKLAKAEGGFSRFPTLSFLEGEPSHLTAQRLPKLLSQENSFLAQALGANTKVLMHSQFKLSDLVHMLGLGDSFNAEAETLGLNPNEVVSPKQFFQSLGIDPHKVIAEIDRLKAQLSKSGLESYLHPQTKAQTKSQHGQKKKIQGINEEPEPLANTKSKTLYPIKKLSQSPELNDLWQGATIAPEAPIETQKTKTSPFTSIEAHQFQKMQGSNHPPIHPELNRYHTEQLQVQGQGFPKEPSVPSKTFEGLRSIPFETEATGTKAAPPSLAFNTSSTEVAQSLHAPNSPNNNVVHSKEIVQQIKDGQVGTPALFPKSRPDNSSKKDLLATTNPILGKRFDTPTLVGTVLGKSMQTDPNLSTHMPPNLGQKNLNNQGANNLNQLDQASRQTASLQDQFDHVSMKFSQPDQTNNFESIQRQLKNPFLQNEKLELDTTPAEGIIQTEPEDAQELNMPNLLQQNTSAENIKPLKAHKKLGMVNGKIEKEVDIESALLSELKNNESFKTLKPKPSTQNIETPEFEVSNYKSGSISSPHLEELTPEMAPDFTASTKQEMIDKIAEQSFMLNRQGGGRANIAISDKNIGQLSLAVQVDGNDVQLKMNSPSDQLRNLIGQDLAGLKETLSSQNLNLVQVDVSSNDYKHEPNHQQSNFQFFEQHQQQGNFSGNSNRKPSIKSIRKDHHRILGAANISANQPNLSQNLLSKHIQVAA